MGLGSHGRQLPHLGHLLTPTPRREESPAQYNLTASGVLSTGSPTAAWTSASGAERRPAAPSCFGRSIAAEGETKNMRLILLLATALLVHLAGGLSSARIPKACHKCRAMCGESVSECVDVSGTSCPSAPRGKASKCLRKTKRQCRKEINTCCTDSCKQTGSPVCCGGPTTTTTEPPGGAESPTTTTEPSCRRCGGPTTTTVTTAPTTTTVCTGTKKGFGGTRTACPTTTTTTLSRTCIPSASAPCVSGCFTDFGDGTIHDHCTGLQWEKKDGDVALGAGPPPRGGADEGDLHNVNNLYEWSGCCDVPETGQRCDGSPTYCQPNAEAAATCVAHSDGGTTGCNTCTIGTCDVDPHPPFPLSFTTVWDWLNQLNASNYAGHNDWRLPSEFGRARVGAGNPTGPCTSAEVCELEGILDSNRPPCGSGACIDPIFGPTARYVYLSSTIRAPAVTTVWGESFSGVYPWAQGTGNLAPNYVRAVRDDK